MRKALTRLPAAARHSLMSLSFGLAVFALSYACGTESIESLTGDDTGSVPGNFMVRVAPKMREKLDALKETVAKVLPGSDFLSRFKGDDGAFGLTGENKLSDLYSIKVPDTGSDKANEFIFGKLKSLTDSGSSYFENVDTDKYIANTSYDTDAINDPDFKKQYYLDMINWEDAVETLTDAQLAAGVKIVVAVLDTGVESKHEDLADVMWKDPDNDKVTGYDALSDSETTTPTDPNGHGSHVAGIVGGTGRNKKGIHGVGYLTPNGGKDSITEIMSVRVLNEKGAGTSEYMAKGVHWAVKEHLKQVKVEGRETQKLIINMSLGGPFETEGYDFPKDEAGNPVFSDDIFEYAASNDALVIVAAGNESCGIGGACKIYGKKYQKTFYFPCSYENVLCIAASTNEDKLAGFSNRHDSIALTAPGWQILSTVPSSVNAKEYAYYNGTSQATPVTAGAASILWSMYPDFSAAEIKAILRKSSAQIDTITGEITSGNGRLDLAKGLEFAAQLKASGESPLDKGEIDPATSPKTLDSPTGEGDPNAASNKIDGDQDSKQTCGTISANAGSLSIALLTMLMPLALAMFMRRR